MTSSIVATNSDDEFGYSSFLIGFDVDKAVAEHYLKQREEAAQKEATEKVVKGKSNVGKKRKAAQKGGTMKGKKKADQKRVVKGKGQKADGVAEKIEVAIVKEENINGVAKRESPENMYKRRCPMRENKE